MDNKSYIIMKDQDMRIVEHSVKRWESYPGADTETCLWEARVEHEGEYYEV